MWRKSNSSFNKGRLRGSRVLMVNNLDFNVCWATKGIDSSFSGVTLTITSYEKTLIGFINSRVNLHN